MKFWGLVGVVWLLVAGVAEAAVPEWASRKRVSVALFLATNNTIPPYKIALRSQGVGRIRQDIYAVTFDVEYQWEKGDPRLPCRVRIWLERRDWYARKNNCPPWGWPESRGFSSEAEDGTPAGRPAR